MHCDARGHYQLNNGESSLFNIVFCKMLDNWFAIGNHIDAFDQNFQKFFDDFASHRALATAAALFQLMAASNRLTGLSLRSDMAKSVTSPI